MYDHVRNTIITGASYNGNGEMAKMWKKSKSILDSLASDVIDFVVDMPLT